MSKKKTTKNKKMYSEDEYNEILSMGIAHENENQNLKKQIIGIDHYVRSLAASHKWVDKHLKYDYDTGYKNGYKMAIYDIAEILDIEIKDPVVDTRLKRKLNI